MKFYTVTLTGNELWDLVDYAKEHVEKCRKRANDPTYSTNYREVNEECARNAEKIIVLLRDARYGR